MVVEKRINFARWRRSNQRERATRIPPWCYLIYGSQDRVAAICPSSHTEKNSDKEWWISPCVEGKARRAPAFLEVKVHFIFTIFQFYSYNVNNNSLSHSFTEPRVFAWACCLGACCTESWERVQPPIFHLSNRSTSGGRSDLWDLAELLATRVWNNDAGPGRCVWHSVVTTMVAGETLKNIYVYLSKSG